MIKNTFRNQRKILVRKEAADKYNHYSTINLEALENSARRLQSNAGFKLWAYMAKNQDKYEFALSSKDFCEWSGTGWKSYKTAFSELESEGFLVRCKGKDCFLFLEYPEKHRMENRNDDVEEDLFEPLEKNEAYSLG